MPIFSQGKYALLFSKECNAGDVSLTGDPPEARLRNGEDSWFSAAISSLPTVIGMRNQQEV